MPPIYGKIEPKFQNQNLIFFRFKRDVTIFFRKNIFPPLHSTKLRIWWYRYGRESVTFKFNNVSQWYDYHSIPAKCTLWRPYDWATLFKLISVHFVLNTLLLLIAHIFYTTNSNSKNNFTEFSNLFRLFRTMQPAPSTICSHYTL